MHGYVQVYTGEGKGKTTAALGLALRACGAGLRVYLAQFIKQGDYSEVRLLRTRFPELTFCQFGRGCFVKGPPTPADIEAAQAGLKALREAVSGGAFDVVIADELCCACKAGLLTEPDLLDLLQARLPEVELVFTGRDAPPALLDRADLVTEMRAVKHYFARGVNARVGIEK
jgi:cob(I)alamin adenosyltransferase